MFSVEALKPRLTRLYSSMDTLYTATAKKVGFSCEGCDGTACCTVDLTLHSFMEMDGLFEGLRGLPRDLQDEIARRCKQTIAFRRQNPAGSDYRESVCVVNFGGRCSLYHCRPMICRLAGIRHTILRPDGALVSGPGCARYEGEIFPKRPGIGIDRTPLYREMAAIEMEVVRLRGARTRSLTVAEVLCGEDFPPSGT